ncbi:MAG: hypothetical protein U0R65_07925 [Candidatus Nanopelagicales bacterium]
MASGNGSPAGQVGGAAEDDPLLAALGDHLQHRGDDGSRDRSVVGLEGGIQVRPRRRERR